MQPAETATPRESDAHILESFDALREKRFEDAIQAAERALSADPAGALYALALVAGALGTSARAIAMLEEAHRHDPEALEIVEVLSAVHARVGHVNEGLYYAKLATALSSRPLLAKAPTEKLGGFFSNLERGQTDYHLARARRHLEQGNAAEAIADATAQLDLTPGDADSLRLLALASIRLQETGRAINVGRSLLHSPDATAEDLSNHASALASHGLFALADACHQMAETAAPEDPLPGQRRLFDLARDPDKSAEERHKAHAHWRERHADRFVPRPLEGDRSFDPDRKLSVGYLCGEIFGRDVTELLGLLLETHRAEGARAICYVEGRRSDLPTEHLIRLAHRWTDIEGVDDETTCQIMRGDRLDLLVDLAGFSAGGRPLVLCRRPAPSIVGFACSAADEMPGVDALLVHGAETARIQKRHVIACARPPVAWHPPALAPSLAPRDFDDPQRIGVLGDPAQLTPTRIGWLAEILHALPETRLAIVGGRDRGPAERAVGAFADFGLRSRVDLVDAAENRFATGFELFRHIDLAVLVAPTDGYLETCRALWMGVPVVVAPDAGRSASVLAAAGRAEWIAGDRESFIAATAAMAADRARLANIRMEMRAEIASSPLLDIAGFASTIRDAYRQAWRTACAPHRQPHSEHIDAVA